MNSTDNSDGTLLKELVRELDEFNSYMRKSKTPLKNARVNGNYYAFNPSSKTDKKKYKKDIKLISITYNVLDENHINVKCLGYTHLKDAVCIITDMKSLDICLVNELYPIIAEKYSMRSKNGIKRVEHSIRNAIDAAYKLTKTEYPDDDCLMNSFKRKPTNKTFILKLTQEVSRRLMNEIDAD